MQDAGVPEPVITAVPVFWKSAVALFTLLAMLCAEAAAQSQPGLLTFDEVKLRFLAVSKAVALHPRGDDRQGPCSWSSRDSQTTAINKLIPAGIPFGENGHLKLYVTVWGASLGEQLRGCTGTVSVNGLFSMIVPVSQTAQGIAEVSVFSLIFSFHGPHETFRNQAKEGIERILDEFIAQWRLALARHGSGVAAAAGSNKATVQLSQTQVRDIQTRLAQLGFYEGVVDGLFGPATRRAIGGFQRSRGLPPTSEFDWNTLQALFAY